jgi:hypothetical protein
LLDSVKCCASLTPRPSRALESTITSKTPSSTALRPDEPLPSTRELARRLGIARNTIAAAFDGLLGEGFLYAKVGAGTFVADTASATTSRRHRTSALKPRDVWARLAREAPAPTEGAEFDFRIGAPDPGLFPWDEWRSLVVRRLLRLYGARRQALLGAVEEMLGDRVIVLSSAVGLHTTVLCRDPHADAEAWGRACPGETRRGATPGDLPPETPSCRLCARVRLDCARAHSGGHRQTSAARPKFGQGCGVRPRSRPEKRAEGVRSFEIAVVASDIVATASRRQRRWLEKDPCPLVPQRRQPGSGPRHERDRLALVDNARPSAHT